MKLILALLTGLLISVLVVACNNGNPSKPPQGNPSPDEPPYREPSVLIRANPELSTFEAALERTDLFHTVDGETADGEDIATSDSLVIITPTEAAFEALYKELGTTEEAFLDRADLASILKYHLAPISIYDVPAKDGTTLTTLEGSTVSVSVPQNENVPEENPNKTVFNGEANTVYLYYGDVNSALIYIVDAVLLPESVE
jgi:uncharacterized surface protein with fasciclin (FAS1) repeats